jgi:hypothetical protein
MEHVFDPNRSSPTSPSFPHAFSGNPGGIRTGPLIKTFGGDDFGVASLRLSQIFEGGHEEHDKKIFTRRRGGRVLRLVSDARL